jgi:putative phosphoesterase
VSDDARAGVRESGFVGLISDTHGLLRPEAVAALEGARLILHAGDVGDLAILDRLRVIAPVRAVHGNTDYGDVRAALPETDLVEIGDGVAIYLLHILDELDVDPEAAGCAGVMYGHTHEPRIERRGPIWYVNPGSAGPRRFKLPVSVARLHVEPDGLRIEIVELDV